MYSCTDKESGDKRTVLRFADNSMSSLTETKSLLYECVVLQQLVHPNIIKCYGFFEKQIEDHKHYFIVLE